VFQMNESSDGQALRYLGFELMQKFNILNKYKVGYSLKKKQIRNINFNNLIICIDTKLSDAKLFRSRRNGIQ